MSTYPRPKSPTLVSHPRLLTPRHSPPIRVTSFALPGWLVRFHVQPTAHKSASYAAKRMTFSSLSARETLAAASDALRGTLSHTTYSIITFRPMSVQRQTPSLARVQIRDLTMLLHFHPTCVKMCMSVPPSGRCRPSASATRPTCRRGPACTWSRAGRPTTRPARCPSPTCTFEKYQGKSAKDMRIF